MISYVPILTATKLRNWIKAELVIILNDVFQNLEIFTPLLITIYYTITMEFYYSAIVDEKLINDLNNIWVKIIENSKVIIIKCFFIKKVLLFKYPENISIIQLCSFLFYSMFGNEIETTKSVENIIKNNFSDALFSSDNKNLFSYTNMVIFYYKI